MSSRRRGRRTNRMEAIARERIAHLLEQAERWALEGRQRDADRCAQLARLIGKRYRQKLTREQRLRVCRGCDGFLGPATARVRLSRKGWRTTTCLQCGRVCRQPLRSKASAPARRRPDDR
jgi:ribonuclease P protein subunit RPR2